MRGLIRLFSVSLLLFVIAAVPSAKADDHNDVVIVFKDGHRQTLSSSEITSIDVKAPASIAYKNGHLEKIKGDVERIEFGSQSSASLPGRSHFIGKWEVGEGNGGHFYVTLMEDGKARKTLGTPNGTWTLVNGQARILWDDGWHDIIRKVSGGKHEKVAFEPGKSFDDEPSNIDFAKNTEIKPI